MKASSASSAQWMSSKATTSGRSAAIALDELAPGGKRPAPDRPIRRRPRSRRAAPRSAPARSGGCRRARGSTSAGGQLVRRTLLESSDSRISGPVTDDLAERPEGEAVAVRQASAPGATASPPPPARLETAAELADEPGLTAARLGR